MIVMYARVARQETSMGKRLGATGWFAGGYFLVWTGFSAAATLVQWMVERAALLDYLLHSAGARRRRCSCWRRRLDVVISTAVIGNPLVLLCHFTLQTPDGGLIVVSTINKHATDLRRCPLFRRFREHAPSERS
jgi:hypothetical protein